MTAFPHNLTFVRNLLRAYRRRETRNPAAREQLLRRHWFYAEDLRSQFFQFLSRRARLQSELDAVRASHPAVAAQRWPELVKANRPQHNSSLRANCGCPIWNRQRRWCEPWRLATQPRWTLGSVPL